MVPGSMEHAVNLNCNEKLGETGQADPFQAHQAFIRNLGKLLFI